MMSEGLLLCIGMLQKNPFMKNPLLSLLFISFAYGDLISVSLAGFLRIFLVSSYCHFSPINSPLPRNVSITSDNVLPMASMSMNTI